MLSGTTGTLSTSTILLTDRPSMVLWLGTYSGYGAVTHYQWDTTGELIAPPCFFVRWPERRPNFEDPAAVSCGRDGPSPLRVRAAPRTDPSERDYRTGLLPWVCGGEADLGVGVH